MEIIKIKDVWKLLTNEQKVILSKNMPSNMSELDFFDYGVSLLKKKTSFNVWLLNKMVHYISSIDSIEKRDELINLIINNENLLWDKNTFTLFTNVLKNSNKFLTEEDINSIIKNTDLNEEFNNKTILMQLLVKNKGYIRAESKSCLLLMIIESGMRLYPSNIDLILKNSDLKKLDNYNQSTLSYYLENKQDKSKVLELNKDQLDYLIRNSDILLEYENDKRLLMLIIESKLNLHPETFDFVMSESTKIFRQNQKILMYYLNQKSKITETQVNYFLKNCDLNTMENIHGNNFLFKLLESNNTKKFTSEQIDYILKNVNLKELGEWKDNIFIAYVKSKFIFNESQIDYLLKNCSLKSNQFELSSLLAYCVSEKKLTETQVDYLINNSEFKYNKFGPAKFKNVLESCNKNISFKQLLTITDKIKKEDIKFLLMNFNSLFVEEDTENITLTSKQWIELFEKVDFFSREKTLDDLVFYALSKKHKLIYGSNVPVVAGKVDDDIVHLLKDNKIPKILFGNIDFAIVLCRVNKNFLDFINPNLIKKLNLTKDNLEDNLFIYENKKFNKFKNFFNIKNDKKLIQGEVYESMYSREEREININKTIDLFKNINFNNEIKESLSNTIIKIKWLSQNEFKGIHDKELLEIKRLLESDLPKELTSVSILDNKNNINLNKNNINLNKKIKELKSSVDEMEITMVSFLNMELRKKTIVEEIKLDVAKHVNDLLLIDNSNKIKSNTYKV